MARSADLPLRVLPSRPDVRRRRTARDPFEVRLTEQQEQELAAWLSDELQHALDARSAIIMPDGLIDYWHALYEQRRRVGLGPWPGAADLASYIVTEKVDALRARLMKTIFVEPVWVVEGWGEAAKRAPIVEEFHQWKVEEERLQSKLGRVLHLALIEGTGILETVERVERRPVRRQGMFAVRTAPDGSVWLNEQQEPVVLVGEDGRYVPAEGDQPAVSMVYREILPVRRGPQHRVISLRDFLVLPGHAQDTDECWGYAKRFWKRVPELRALEDQGVYKNVDKLGLQGEREQHEAQLPIGQQVAPQDGATAEKELFSVLLLADLDGDGMEEWYEVTLSKLHRVLLRVQHADLDLPRYRLFRPFPRPTSVYGYSFAEKLSTLAEEHTALRNMIADRSALVTNAPIKRVQGALWDPDTQPFGPRAVIDVRDPNEVQPMDIPDVPVSAVQREAAVFTASERLSGLNDVAAGINPDSQRTLGEIQLVTEQSFVRLEESLHYCQEELEDLFVVRHELWIRALEADPVAAGGFVPERVVRSLELRGQQLSAGHFTADLLRGPFRGKPRGSVETADLNRMRADFNGLVAALTGMAERFPVVGQLLMRPEAIRALLEELLRVYRVRDRQAFLLPPGEFERLFQPQAPMAAAGMVPPGIGVQPGGLPGMAGAPGGPLPPALAALLQSGGAETGSVQ